MMILICYDVSSDAQAATDRAGLLMPGSDATVLVVGETLLETMTRNGSLGVGLGLVGDYGDGDTYAPLERAAVETATDGAQCATAAGLVARPRISNRDDDITGVILAVAADVDAEVIVLGTRGRGGVRSLMLGQHVTRGPSPRRPAHAGRAVPGPRRAASSMGRARPDHGDRHMNRADRPSVRPTPALAQRGAGKSPAATGYTGDPGLPQKSDADHPCLIEEHHIVGPHGDDEIEATDERGRRWYHLRPEPRCRADFVGLNYT